MSNPTSTAPSKTQLQEQGSASKETRARLQHCLDLLAEYLHDDLFEDPDLFWQQIQAIPQVRPYNQVFCEYILWILAVSISDVIQEVNLTPVEQVIQLYHRYSRGENIVAGDRDSAWENCNNAFSQNCDWDTSKRVNFLASFAAKLLPPFSDPDPEEENASALTFAFMSYLRESSCRQKPLSTEEVVTLIKNKLLSLFGAPCDSLEPTHTDLSKRLKVVLSLIWDPHEFDVVSQEQGYLIYFPTSTADEPPSPA
jgi:hypothetical protein